MGHGDRIRRALRAAAGAAMLLAAAPPALATHLVDHRYTVWGTVTYEDGDPAVGVPVEFTVKGGHSIGTVKTDKRGRYQAVLHVHNQDLRKVFDMHVAGQNRKARILFNPSDTATERGQAIDFTVEREAAAAAIEAAAKAEAERKAGKGGSSG